MHRNFYSLDDEQSVDKALKGFIFDYLDLFMEIPESLRHDFEITEDITNRFKAEIKKEDLDFFSWIIYNVDDSEANPRIKFLFIRKLFELLNKEKK